MRGRAGQGCIVLLCCTWNRSGRLCCATKPLSAHCCPWHWVADMEVLCLTVTHIFLLWAKDLISLVDLAALGGRARDRTCSMKPVIGPRPSSGRPTWGMPDAPTVS